MERVRLGNTNIEVSRLGIGTGTAGPSGYCVQAMMNKNELAELLIFAFDNGINFWDTAFQYNTYPHIKEALKQVSRSDIVLATKLTTSNEKTTIRDFSSSLRALDVDYIDICLLHGVKTKAEFTRRSKAFNTMIKLKTEGKIRAVGLSSHGLNALKHVIKIPEIDLVWARINFAGFNMDASSLGIYDQLASVPLLNNIALHLPERIKSAIRPNPESQFISKKNRNEVEETLKKIHSRSIGVVGMKVLGEGRFRNRANEAIEYVRDLPFVDSYIVGMLNKKEITENCRITNELPKFI